MNVIKEKGNRGKQKAENVRVCRTAETIATRRQASTLAEVLVSIMILSIGIISLATLFPISILRSLQATQLTNATILRFNAESQIDVSPSIVYDPVPGSNLTGTNYIVDPLGFARSEGNIGTAPLQLQRFAGFTAFKPPAPNAERDALATVTLPDSWILQLDGTGTWVPTSAMPPITTGFTFTEGDLSSVPFTSETPSRIVLFDETGKKSQVRTISDITGQTVEWNGADNLTVGIARIETREIRYTWMLTVRNNASGLASVDVVVFFRRAFSPEDNTVHDATFVSGNRTVGIIQAPGSEPSAKKGGFVLDVQNALWYRIQDIKTGANGYTHFLEIEQPAGVGAGEDLNLNGALDDPPEDFNGSNDLDFGGAVFMQGVVEVFPLGVK